MDVFFWGYGTGALHLEYFGPPWANTLVTSPTAPSQANIAAVSQAAGHLDVFFVAFNGGIAEAAS